jgi:hypothetical protein
MLDKHNIHYQLIQHNGISRIAVPFEKNGTTASKQSEEHKGATPTPGGLTLLGNMKSADG